MITILTLLTCLTPWTGSPTAPQKLAEIGEVPHYAFQQPLLNGMGTASLEDLRGRPVFIEFWGRKGASVDDSMRATLAWQEAYGDDLTVLLVEVKQATDLQVTSLALKKKWLGGRAMWTTEKPCHVGLKGALPQFVLLSSEGVVLLKGTTESFELGYRDELAERIEDTLKAEIERRRRGPADLSASLVPAWEAFCEGRIAIAFELTRSLTADAATATSAEETLKSFRERIQRRLKRVGWQIENGFLLQAEAELDRLDGQLNAEEPLASRQTELVAALRDESLLPEWKAAKDLAKLEKKLYDSGSKSVLVRQLDKLAKKHAETQTGARAAHLFEAAQVSPYQ